MDSQDSRQMTPGEIAVGLKFNPSGDGTVEQLKQAFAQIFDIVEGSLNLDQDEDANHTLARKRKMRDAALHEIVSAQMWAVKVVTLDK